MYITREFFSACSLESKDDIMRMRALARTQTHADTHWLIDYDKGSEKSENTNKKTNEESEKIGKNSVK